MGNSSSKLNFRKAVIQLTAKNQSIDDNDDNFWSQFWSNNINIQDIYTLIPAFEIRAVREEAPTNLAALCFKVVLKIKECSENNVIIEKNQIAVLNCVRLLTRIFPYIFEEPEWRGFFWSDYPATNRNEKDSVSSISNESTLAQLLMDSLIALLFIPEFTVHPHKKSHSSDEDKLRTIDSCEYIWEAGVGFSHSPPQNYTHDFNRTEILKLLLTTFSETIYLQPLIEYHAQPNLWISYFTSFKNQHALPLFTSLVNVIFSYDPVGFGLPYNYLMFTDSRESLVEISCQLLCVVLESNINYGGKDAQGQLNNDDLKNVDGSIRSNLFINYISRIHRDEDFSFILKGFCRLLNNPITQTFLPSSAKKISFHQELLILFWKFCDYNKKFMYFVLKSSEVLDILVPILYFLIDARADTSKIGLIHIGVFILLLLSGERNFGVRLNKPYISRIPIDIPVFSGTHADLLIIVFHKLITSTNHRLQPLYDCLLTIVVNISPYIKSLSMVASTKILHLLEAFSNNTFLFSNSNNYYLVFFILEVLNNIIQYQFDGNYNLVYTIIRKRNVFFNLINLPTDQSSIDSVFNKQQQQQQQVNRKNAEASKIKSDSSFQLNQNSNQSPNVSKSMEGALPAKEAEPGTLKTTLAETPSILKMTEKTISSNDKENNSHNDIINFENSSNTNSDMAAPSTSSSSINNNSNNNNNLLLDLEQGVNNLKEMRLNSSSNEQASASSQSSTSNGNGHDNGQSNKSQSSKLATPAAWYPTTEWLTSWKSKLPLQTIMRLLQVLVPQVEKICLDKGLTDESEILKFLQNGTLVGLLPVPHPILIRKYQPNFGTLMWFKTYLWGVIYLVNLDPPIWYDTDVKLFEIQRI